MEYRSVFASERAAARSPAAEGTAVTRSPGSVTLNVFSSVWIHNSSWPGRHSAGDDPPSAIVPFSSGDRSVRAPVAQSTRVSLWVGNASTSLDAAVVANSNQRPLADADTK